VTVLAPAGLQSHLRIVARLLQGRTVVADLSAQGQLVARLTGPPGPVATVHLVAQAAGPLNGDELTIEVEVGPGAALCVRSTAATLALPAPGQVSGPSRVSVTADVGEHASLDWRPEPVVLADGAELDSRTRFRLSPSARLAALEVLVLGRHQETGGRACAAVGLDVAGEPVLRQRLDTDTLDRAGRWVGWQERVSAALLLAGPEVEAAAGVSDRAVVMPPRLGVVVGSATGPSATDVSEQLRAAAAAGGAAWPWQ
jgi:urease accessory protein